MSKFTYEEKNTESIYETYEWDNVWIEHANEADRKRVLYIGDSISCGIRHQATAAANEEILFDGFGTSKGLDNPYFKDALSIFHKQLPKESAILFNNGLHGWHLSEEEYEKLFDEMVSFILASFNKKLYLLLTTYITDEERNKRVKLRNEAVKRVAEKYSLPVIDLYSVTEENKDKLTEDGVHPTEELYKRLAAVILEKIEE